jgi:hypothetical protein
MDKKNTFILENYRNKIENEISLGNIDEQTRLEKLQSVEKLQKILNLEKNLMVDEENKIKEAKNKTIIDEGEGEDDKIKYQIEEAEKIAEEILQLRSSMGTPTVEINEYKTEDIDKFLDNFDFGDFENKPYMGYDENAQIPRVLVISHSGFISEMINLIRKFHNLKSNIKNETTNTGVHMFKIYCTFCGTNSPCANLAECKKGNYKLEFDHVLVNDTGHLSVLKDF